MHICNPSTCAERWEAKDRKISQKIAGQLAWSIETEITKEILPQ